MNKELKYKIITQEWDKIALERFNDLKKGKDKSYSEILKPNLLSIIKERDLTSILDVGCGVGVFTEELGKYSKQIKAIDISRESINIATLHSNNKCIKYECKNFFDLKDENNYTTIISNMTLQAIPDISHLFVKVKNLLNQDGTFIFTITHPSFWPIYWNYHHNKNFNYKAEFEVITDFKIRDKVYANLKTRHYHRPVEHYLNLIISSGLNIINFKELQSETEELWYPRFLLIECKR